MPTDEEMRQIAKDARQFFVEYPRMFLLVLWLPFYLMAKAFRRTD